MNKKLDDFNKRLQSEKIAILGIGVSNIPLLSYLGELGCNVTLFNDKEITDNKIISEIEKYKYQLYYGENYLDNLKGFDIIFRSPGALPTIKELKEEKERGALVTTEVEMVMKLTPSKIIGVTGSDGKTTTTTLIYEILKGNGYNCFVGGNIGIPLFTKIKDMKSEDIIVLELSSFQLMDMDISPNISVITNISPNHLDKHTDYEEYINAKKEIFLHQNSNDLLVLNYNNEIVNKFDRDAKGKVLFFSGQDKLENGYYVDGKLIKYQDKVVIDANNILLRGHHNYENICTALTALNDLIDMDKTKEVISKFKGVEHRLEFVREIDGVKWYNDSVSSSPTRAIAGLKAYEEKIVLIAGGYDKQLDYTPIGEVICDNVSSLILMGDTKEKIYEATVNAKNYNNKLNICKVDSLEDAIKKAKEYAKEGEIVLFSPASASFDMFKNFAERGNKYKQLVNEL